MPPITSGTTNLLGVAQPEVSHLAHLIENPAREEFIPLPLVGVGVEGRLDPFAHLSTEDLMLFGELGRVSGVVVNVGHAGFLL